MLTYVNEFARGTSKALVTATFQNMAADAVPVAIITVFWAIIGGVLPFVLGRGPNKGVIQVVLVITACTCWLFWLLAYMHQINPLIGPNLHNTTAIALKYLWDGTLNRDDLSTTEHPHTSTTEASFNMHAHT
ncbi:unnamed protein product, partial [Meganyctiphanes norvegica]